MFRRFRRTKVVEGHEPAPRAQLEALSEKLAAKRGDNISHTGPSAAPSGLDLAEKADMLRIVNMSGEDAVLEQFE